MTVNSPEPGTPQTKTKAYVAAAAAATVAFLGALGTALTDGSVSAQEWTTVIIAGIVGAGLAGIGTAATPNRPL